MNIVYGNAPEPFRFGDRVHVVDVTGKAVCAEVVDGTAVLHIGKRLWIECEDAATLREIAAAATKAAGSLEPRCDDAPGPHEGSVEPVQTRWLGARNYCRIHREMNAPWIVTPERAPEPEPSALKCEYQHLVSTCSLDARPVRVGYEFNEDNSAWCSAAIASYRKAGYTVEEIAEEPSACDCDGEPAITHRGAKRRVMHDVDSMGFPCKHEFCDGAIAWHRANGCTVEEIDASLKCEFLSHENGGCEGPVRLYRTNVGRRDLCRAAASLHSGAYAVPFA